MRIKRILLECTHTYETGLNTGIQRVTRNIVNESKYVSNELGVECHPVILKQGRFLSVGKIKNKRSFRAESIAILKKVYMKVRPILRKILFFPHLEEFLFYKPGYLTAIVCTFLDVLAFPVLLFRHFRNKVSPRKGDLLLLLDSSWVYRVWTAVKQARDNGVIVGAVIYDLFPITHPHFCVPELTYSFQRWFDQAMDNADFFIAISQTTRDEVKKYVTSKRPSDNWDGRFESFRLGSVIDSVVSNGEIRDELRKIFESSGKLSTYLSVGTIEPRKNHKYLLDAFDEVMKKCPEVRLCIIGRLGWYYSELLKRIESHPEYNKRVFLFKDLSDTELDYCYRNARALVFCSHAEGFGLPIVEALYKQLPVLASNIPVFREVGREFCTYFDLGQSASLANIIIDIEEKKKVLQVHRPEECKLTNWKDSCRELLSKAFALCEKISV